MLGVIAKKAALRLVFGVAARAKCMIDFIFVGLTMFHILPRNYFSQVQSALFTKFVCYCMVLSSLSLSSYYFIIKSQPFDRVLNKVSLSSLDLNVGVLFRPQCWRTL